MKITFVTIVHCLSYANICLSSSENSKSAIFIKSILCNRKWRNLDYFVKYVSSWSLIYYNCHFNSTTKFFFCHFNRTEALDSLYKIYEQNKIKTKKILTGSSRGAVFCFYSFIKRHDNNYRAKYHFWSF